MKKKFIALALSAVCMGAECSAAPFTVSAEEQWIPQDFDSAAAFFNEYGAVHIEGNTVCYVRKNYKYTGETYALEFTENSGITDYLSRNIYEYTSEDRSDTTEISIEAYIFELPKNSTLEIYTYTLGNSGKKRNELTYTFTADENGNITETDMFAWLPDSMTEYNDYIKENGTVSLRGNKIIYCGDVNYSTGDEIIFEQLGTAEVKEIYSSYVSLLSQYPDPPGNTSHKVIVYEPVSEGDLKLSWKVARPWDMSHITSENTNYYTIDENLTITETSENDDPAPVKCDLNDDGEFNAADLVLLQKWLLGGNVELKNWASADLCADGRLDVYDICLMKKELVNALNT